VPMTKTEVISTELSKSNCFYNMTVFRQGLFKWGYNITQSLLE
jgi:hypothetical protein